MRLVMDQIILRDMTADDIEDHIYWHTIETHIGSVTAYFIDTDYNWTRNKIYCTVGIDLCDTTSWCKGYGTQALKCFIHYLLNQGFNTIHTQTWSGNKGMIALATKLGFLECNRKPQAFHVRGASYDSLTFKLNVSYFLTL